MAIPDLIIERVKSQTWRIFEISVVDYHGRDIYYGARLELPKRRGSLLALRDMDKSNSESPKASPVAPSGEALAKSPSQRDVSVVIVTRDRPAELAKCLESLEQVGGRIREVIIVDDASRSAPAFEDSVLKTRVLRNPKRSFLAQSRNRGAKESSGKYVMFIDDDNVLGRDSIDELAAVLDDDPQTMVASPVICYTSQPKKVWFAGGWLAPVSGIFVADFRGTNSESLPTTPYHTELFHDAFMLRRKLFEQFGYFDEVNFPMYLSEADLAARLRERGFKALVVPRARIWHSIPPLEGSSSLLRSVHITEPARAYFVGRNRLLYMRKYSNLVSFLIYVVVFEPVFVSIHVFAMLSSRSGIRWTRLFGPYLRGVFDGLAGRVRMGRRLLESVS